MHTIIEPFRIKSVEPIRPSTRTERELWLARAKLNLFSLHTAEVLIDLLTDSGTGAMSSEQWAAIMRGDETYAGAVSFDRFQAAVRETTGFEHVIPTHQGRAAEHLLFGLLGGPGRMIPNNTHFDTTRANIEIGGACAADLPCRESADLHSDEPFKGNMDLEALERVLHSAGKSVPLVMVTITNNAGGGQPVSLANLRGVRALCDRYAVPLFLDACRFAENAWLVRAREPGQHGRTPAAIARSFFDLADGCTMSAKKDGLANIGGFIALRDPEMADELRTRLVVTEGFPTYGGLAGRDLEAIAVGLREVLDPDYLEYRHASIRYVVERLRAAGVPVAWPAGGHAVFLDARRFLPHLDVQEFPGQALALELYLEGGIRSCEIGSVMLGRTNGAGEFEPAQHELVRLAIPRRTYTQSHMDYVLEVIQAVWQRREGVRGVRISKSPKVLRHFRAEFERTPERAGAAR
ncbi:MAG: tryptophanase [Planctomycetes bacterium]|nr:tryptophanase [Planctomycetota bacterium]